MQIALHGSPFWMLDMHEFVGDLEFAFLLFVYADTAKSSSNHVSEFKKGFA